MFYEKELQFLCDTFKKCRVETKLVSSEDSVGSVISTDIYAIFGRAVDGAQNVGRFLGELERGTVYKMKNLAIPTLSFPPRQVRIFSSSGPIFPSLSKRMRFWSLERE